METKLDVTDLAVEEQGSKIKSAVNDLKEGDTIFVKSTADFKQLVGEILDTNKSKIEWQPYFKAHDVWSGYLTNSSDAPTGIFQLMEKHHKYCDSLYVKGENALSAKNETEGKALIEAFFYNMDLHFQREEKLLFVAFENKTGMTQGPTQVMRMEHEQIRGVLKEMRESLDTKNFQRVFDQAEALLMLIQQHNSKEENMLYPMCDQHLGDSVQSLLKEMILHFP
jgi:hemerythrin-like domain-containing protein